MWATASICLATIFIMGPTTTSSLRALGIEYGDAVAAQRLAREKAELEARGRALREEAAGGLPPERGFAERLDLAVQRAVFGRKAFEMLQHAGGHDINEAEPTADAAVSRSNSLAKRALSSAHAAPTPALASSAREIGVRVLALPSLAEEAEAASPEKGASAGAGADAGADATAATDAGAGVGLSPGTGVSPRTAFAAPGEAHSAARARGRARSGVASTESGERLE